MSLLGRDVGAVSQLENDRQVRSETVFIRCGESPQVRQFRLQHVSILTFPFRGPVALTIEDFGRSIVETRKIEAHAGREEWR